ncbi:MAG: hypothetical protein WD512_06055, partial [Candidatus Paceibacterota bacterium]
MKKIKLFYTLAISVFVSSCATTFYQVYETTPVQSEDYLVKDDSIIYEDENCKVTYNFWSDGGNIGFEFYNKTDESIILNMEESFFIKNGIAYNYYKQRVYTSSSSSGTMTSSTVNASKSVSGINYNNLFQTNKAGVNRTRGAMTGSGYSVSYEEEKFVIIPPKTAKYILEYSINESIYRDCDLYKYPTKKQINTITLSEADSPYNYGNRLTYSVDSMKSWTILENNFYVSKITNYPEKEFIEMKFEEYCGEKSYSKKR